MIKATEGQEFRLGIYEHYKGRKYLVIGIAKHSETLEELVVYISLYENETSQMWVRPLKMFQDKVTLEGKQVPRFRYLGVS